MKKEYVLILLLIFSCKNTNDSINKKEKNAISNQIITSNNEDCDFKNVLTKDLINENDVYLFLKQLNINCKSNVEYSQFSNELIFKALELHTLSFVEAFAKFPNNKRNYLLIKLKSPISDKINLIKIKNNLDLIIDKNESDIKLLKESIEVAINKYNKS